MVEYTKEELWDLFGYLKERGWWWCGYIQGEDHHGNTALMRLFKHHVTRPEDLVREIKKHRKCQEEYIYIFETPLRDLPLHINDKNLKDITTWRLGRGK